MIPLANLIKKDSSEYGEDVLHNCLLHLDRNRADYTMKTTDVPADVAWKHQGNFYGLLSYLGIETKYHLYVLHMNGLTNSTDYDGRTLRITLPNYQLLERVALLLNG